MKKAILTLLLTRLTHESAKIFICKSHRNCWHFSRNPLGFQILISLDSSMWAVPSLPTSYQGALQRKNFCRRKRSFNRNTMKQTATPSHFLLQQAPCRSSPCWVSETRGAHASLFHVIPPDIVQDPPTLTLGDSRSVLAEQNFLELLYLQA